MSIEQENDYNVQPCDVYLEDSEEIGFFKNSHIPIYMGDLWGYITYVNQSAVQLVGAKDDSDLVGKHVLNFVAEKDRARAFEISINSIKCNQGKTENYHVVTKSGKSIKLEVKTSFLIDRQGEKVGFIGFVLNQLESPLTKG